MELEVPEWDEKDAIGIDEVLKPYPNEHACRLEDPGQFERFARKNCYKKSDGKCIDFIFGFPKGGGGKLQAMRYGKEVWTAAAARAHCSSHKGSFEAAKEVSDILLAIEEFKSSVMEILKGMIEKHIELLNAIQALKPVEPSGTDLAVKPTDQSSKDGDKGENASKAILEDGFKQGKKPTPPPPPPRLQYDFSGVVKELKELVKQLKGE